MKQHRISRRQFLQGAGGTTLAIPFLSSLSTPADAAYFAGTKYFLAMASEHGVLVEQDLYPSGTPASQQQLYTGDASAGRNHVAHYGQLADMLTTRYDEWNNGTSAEISPVLGGYMNSHLDQINVIRGLDIMHYIAHHRGGFLGNYHANDTFQGARNPALTFEQMPTIDHVIANSPHFYTASDPSQVPLLTVGSTSRTISYGRSSTGVEATPETAETTYALFDYVFGNFDGETDRSRRLSLIDRVLADYNRVSSGTFGPGRRISYEDRSRLNDHVDHLRTLENKIGTQGGCTVDRGVDRDFHLTGSFEHQSVDWATFIDVIAAAFKCGASRIATSAIYPHTQYYGDYHANIAHNNLRPESRRELIITNRFIAEHVFMRLVQALDEEIVPGEGTTYLDNALIVWQQEHGQNQHSAASMPVITAGSAGGYFNTGLYVDYRNHSNLSYANHVTPEYPGLPQNRWLYTVLRSMGVEDNEYQHGAFEGLRGYGDPHIGIENWNSANHSHVAYPQRVLDGMNTPLPIIVA